ncbi:MAG: winged helix-turn-helix domain-containing protein [Solirubrobacteraceae bacterium]
MTEGTTTRRGLEALTGAGKRLVLHELAGGEPLTVAELVSRTGLSRNAVTHVLEQLEQAGVAIRRKQAGRVVTESAPERAELIASLVSLDSTIVEVHPVPGRLLDDGELDLYARQLAGLPRVMITEDYPEDELSTPLSALVIGDPVD